MTVEKLKDALQLKTISLPSPNREVDGAYCGDLLSWVMGRAQENNVWITIMSNINTVAVAALADVSCIIVAEDVQLEESVIETAAQKQINILSSAMPIYETAIAVSKLI